MRPRLVQLPGRIDQSFSIRRDIVPHFFTELHYHDEIELVWIEAGSGTRFIGNHIATFGPGDMVLVGSGTPHLWRCDAAYFEKNQRLKAISTVVHLLPAAFGEAFWNMPEHNRIKKLLKQCERGLVIHLRAQVKIIPVLQEMLQQEGPSRIRLLLHLLDILSRTSLVSFLQPPEAINTVVNRDTARMNNVLEYLFNHFRKPVTLKQVAAVANLSPNACCRFIKQHTRSSLSDLLHQLRINHACKLLQETELPVSNICYESGFNNFSNFNRYFLQRIGVTPLQYRKEYDGET